MPKEINMKRITLIIVLTLITITAFAQENNERTFLGEEWAKKYINDRINGNNKPYLPKGGIIKSKEMAIQIAEIYLKGIFGPDVIENEKPFEVYKYNGYWLIAGTLPKEWVGGTVVIIISQKTGQVLAIEHYQ
jgi:hypothetical protein